MQRIRRNFPIILLIAISIFAIPRLSFGETADNYDSLLSKGIVGLEHNDLDLALRHFKAALSKKPNGVQAYYYIAVTHARANRVAEAEKTFQKTLKLDRTFMPAHFDLAVLYYQIREDEKALKSFELLRRIDPERARVYFYEGVILRRNGKESEAEAKLEKAVSLDPALAAEMHFLSGASEFQAGDLDSAMKEFQGVITLSSDGELADSAREFITRIDTMPKQKKRFHLTASLGIQYDDNVILEPRQTSAAPAGISEKSDFVGIFYLRGKYQWLKSRTWNGELALSYFTNFHTEEDLNDFDIQDTHLSTQLGRRFGKNELGLKYELQFATLGGNDFLLSQKIGPRFIRVHSKKQLTEVTYFYGNKDFKDNFPLFPQNSERDVKVHQATLSHYLRIGDNGSIYGSYAFEMEEAGDAVAEDDWSFDSHHIKIGLALPAWKKITTTFEANATQRQFKNKNQLDLSKERKDEDLLFILAFSRPLNQHLNLTAQYLYQDNNSNIPVFAYRRGIIGLIATATY